MPWARAVRLQVAGDASQVSRENGTLNELP